MFIAGIGIRICVLFLVLCGSVKCFNVDTQYPIVINGSRGSYFGYTTALHRNGDDFWALIGAPRANTTTFRDAVYQPGTLFKCKITTKGSLLPCEEVPLMREGAVETQRTYAFAYEDKKDNMWLGASLDIRQGQRENDVVACGHLWRNQYHSKLHLVNGVCYVINGNLEQQSVKKLLPLTQREQQYGRDSAGATEYNHAHGQVGISASYSEDGSNLVLGAPGIWSWTGSIVQYGSSSSNRDDFYRNPIVPHPNFEINFNSYFGYSVTTGRFFDSKTDYIVAGAPRDGGNNGKVYIFRQRGNNMIIKQRKQGVQLGEYFGASVLAINVNGDTFTDLLVGAPLNSLDSGGDEGKVYVYISNGKDLQKQEELAGDRKPYSRFGTTLANVGDLDLDGFSDIAVGAPYEDDGGAVYIYHGSRSGIKAPYVQKIEASSVRPRLSGFGIHISRGMDVDNNGYKDILIGSYDSSNAILLRSRPVIEVFPGIIFSPKQLNLNQTTCKFQNRTLTCIEINACLRYSVKRVNYMTLDVALIVASNDPAQRAFIPREENSVRGTRRPRQATNTFQRVCGRSTLYLKPGIKDVITPIPVKFSWKVSPVSGDPDVQFIKTYPVYHPNSPKELISLIPFNTGCGKDDECRSDLIVSATRTEPSEGGVMTLGTVSIISIQITVKNTGEPAYLSELLINLPPEMPIINQDFFCDSGNLNNIASVVCDIGNPLKNGSQVDINIKLDATKIPPHKKYLEIICRAVTLSTEVNPDNNVEIVPLHLETVADIGITGSSSINQIWYDGRRAATPTISHTFAVRNHGPSPVQTIDILLHVPYTFVTSTGKEQFVSFTGLRVDNGNPLLIPAVCEETPFIIQPKRRITSTSEDELDIGGKDNITVAFIPEELVKPPDELSDVKPTVHLEEKESGKNSSTSVKARGYYAINCDRKEIECLALRCSAAPFENLRKFTQISLDFQLNFTVINDYLSSWYQMEFSTIGYISVSNASVTELHTHPEVAEAETTILRDGPIPPEELAPWIVFVSVGVGVILLLFILILLIKVGFFKRKEKDKMRLLMTGSDEVQPNDQQEADDIEVFTE